MSDKQEKLLIDVRMQMHANWIKNIQMCMNDSENIKNL